MQENKLKELMKIIPFKFRVWNWIGSYTKEWSKKIYEKYSVLAYIDSRDVMDRFDEVFWLNWWREDYSVDWKKHCRISIYNDNWCVISSRTDAWIWWSIAKEKAESSDAFKRAAVNYGVGRFLYTVPFLTVNVNDRKSSNRRYDITSYVKQKHISQLKEWSKQYSLKVEDLFSTKYSVDDEWTLESEQQIEEWIYIEKIKSEFPEYKLQPWTSESQAKTLYFKLIQNGNWSK